MSTQLVNIGEYWRHNTAQDGAYAVVEIFEVADNWVSYRTRGTNGLFSHRPHQEFISRFTKLNDQDE
jgi:hypothetical protein